MKGKKLYICVVKIGLVIYIIFVYLCNFILIDIFFYNLPDNKTANHI